MKYKLRNWLMKWLGVEDFKQYVIARVNYRNDEIETTLNKLKEYTRVDADVGIRSNNTIILTGVYRGKGYVKFYDLGDGEFINMVEKLRDLRKHSIIRNIDAPPHALYGGLFELKDHEAAKYHTR